VDRLYQGAGGDDIRDVTTSSGMGPDETGLGWGLGDEGRPGKPAGVGRRESPPVDRRPQEKATRLEYA
jgi:hypothetical protein